MFKQDVVVVFISRSPIHGYGSLIRSSSQLNTGGLHHVLGAAVLAFHFFHRRFHVFEPLIRFDRLACKMRDQKPRHRTEPLWQRQHDRRRYLVLLLLVKVNTFQQFFWVIFEKFVQRLLILMKTADVHARKRVHSCQYTSKSRAHPDGEKALLRYAITFQQTWVKKKERDLQWRFCFVCFCFRFLVSNLI